MARTITNTAEVYVGTHEVANVVDITYTPPTKATVKSNALGESSPTVIGLGSTQDPYKLDIEVEIDGSDTNGQAALDAAYSAGSTVIVNYYPEGNTTGNQKVSGDAYVLGIPTQGGQGKDKVKSGTYALEFTTKPAESTVS